MTITRRRLIPRNDTGFWLLAYLFGKRDTSKHQIKKLQLWDSRNAIIAFQNLPRIVKTG